MTEMVVSESSAMMGVIERIALDKDYPIEKMERLLDMQERIMDKQAEQAYSQAMCAAQAEMPTIEKDAKNDHTKSRFSKHETIIQKIKPIYTHHGFSLSFGTGDARNEGQLRITCEVSHSGGHSKQFHIDLDPDDTGAKGNATKTKVHGAGSTNSYGRRYLTLMIFNLATGDDNDGNQETTAYITGKQVQLIRQGLEETNSSEEEYLKYLKVESIEDIIQPNFKRAMVPIDAKRAIIEGEKNDNA